MRGRGVDDYLWISPDGVINLFPNQNTPADTATRGDVHRGIWGGVFAPIHTGKDRRSLHIAETGMETGWMTSSVLTNGPDTPRFGKAAGMETHTTPESFARRLERIVRKVGEWATLIMATISQISRTSSCFGSNQDLLIYCSGDGKADYLCMSKNGYIRVNHHNDELFDVGQVKFSEDLDRENFSFADVNGDKKVDMIWLDKFGGEARVWRNIEYLEHPDDRVSGSKVRCNHIGPRYLQSARGANIHFPNLGGQGTADMVEVRADTAHVRPKSPSGSGVSCADWDF